MENKNFEENLPNGYTLAFQINAKDKKTGIIFTLLSFVPIVILITIAWLLTAGKDFTMEDYFYSSGIFLLILLIYVVLHELTHGVAYKALTGQKLTFGLSWSCAYCGVPGIYVYRKASMIAMLMPFIVFTLLFTPITVWLYFVNPVYFLEGTFILGLHLGGCVGDLYGTLLFMTKFKDEKTLLRDTGPEQSFYLPPCSDSQES